MLQIHASGESCLGDFTFDFYWQHLGSRLDPDSRVDGTSYRRMVEALKAGDDVKITGDVGSRLGSGLGVDLMRLGGRGGPIEATGSIIVDGDVGGHMGISILRGAIYVSGGIKEPLGNLVAVQSERSGFRKFLSMTEVLEKGYAVLEPNEHRSTGLIIRDGIIRDTIGARNPTDRRILIDGDSGMSTGILMRSGKVEVSGSSGRNTGVLLSGGRVVVLGSTGDFTGAEMRSGEIIVEGDAGGFTCARMRGGAVYAMRGKPVPPARARAPDAREVSVIARALGIPAMHAMMYQRLGL